MGKTIKQGSHDEPAPEPEIGEDGAVMDESGNKTDSKAKKSTKSKKGAVSGETSSPDTDQNASDGSDAGAGETAEESPQDVEESEADPLELAKSELASERDKYLRLAAEYDNFRKRSMKELKTVYSDARADTITKLLPVYDNLERALKMECSDEPFYKGVEMIMTQLTEILDTMDVKRIEAAGQVFDPNRHNAVMTIVDPELGEKAIAEEFQKGFTLGERVIRYSTVVVAN